MRKIIATAIALGMVLMGFAIVATPAQAAWTNPHTWEGYVYDAGGTTLDGEISTTFTMIIAVNEQGDGLYYPDDPTKQGNTYDTDGASGRTIINSMLGFGYTYLTMQVGEPGNDGMEFKIYVYGSAFTSVTSQDGWCGVLGATPDPVTGLYAEADTIFTFAVAAPSNIHFQVPGVPTGPGDTFPPEVTASAATGAILAGDIGDYSPAAKRVTITATIEDIADGDEVNGARVSVAGGAYAAMTYVDTVGLAKNYVYYYQTPVDQADAVVEYKIQGSDVSDLWNTTDPVAAPALGSFEYADITNPDAAWTSQPATAFIDSTANFKARYDDFSDMNFAIGASYFEYQFWAAGTTAEGWNAVVWSNDGFTAGSYHYELGASVPTGGRAVGDTLEWRGQVTDGTGLITTLGAGGPITLDQGSDYLDPFPVYGFSYLYDGTAAVGYAPVLVDGTVTVSWYNMGVFASITEPIVAGQYSIDIANAEVGHPYGIQVTVTTTAGNVGYSEWRAITADSGIHGEYINVVSGIPYDVVYTVLVDNDQVYAGIPFEAEYMVVDIGGTVAPGYFTHDGGLMTFHTDDPVLPLMPVGVEFNGMADHNGVYLEMITLLTPGFWYLNVTEGGNDFADFLLTTEFGAFDHFMGDPPALVPGYLKDWANVTLEVLGGGFDWNLVVGWNIVSAPQDPVMKGLDGVFGAFDALEICFAITNDPTMRMGRRDGVGAYTTFAYGMLEGVAEDFPIDGVHSYWIYSETAEVVNFVALDYDLVADPTANVLNAAAGWNMIGFTHNFDPWFSWPMASDFTSGLIDANLNVGVGGNGRIVVSYWHHGTQSYNSYVDTTYFPGMPTKDWEWENAYSVGGMPGSGAFLWVDAATTITFNVNY